MVTGWLVGLARAGAGRLVGVPVTRWDRVPSWRESLGRRRRRSRWGQFGPCGRRARSARVTERLGWVLGALGAKGSEPVARAGVGGGGGGGSEGGSEGGRGRRGGPEGEVGATSGRARPNFGVGSLLASVHIVGRSSQARLHNRPSQRAPRPRPRAAGRARTARSNTNCNSQNWTWRARARLAVSCRDSAVARSSRGSRDMGTCLRPTAPHRASPFTELHSHTASHCLTTCSTTTTGRGSPVTAAHTAAHRACPHRASPAVSFSRLRGRTVGSPEAGSEKSRNLSKEGNLSARFPF
jgi:hypothetical protein